MENCHGAVVFKEVKRQYQLGTFGRYTRRVRKQGMLIGLQKAQDIYGYLPVGLCAILRQLGIKPAKVWRGNPVLNSDLLP